jgi:hypothetical protein
VAKQKQPGRWVVEQVVFPEGRLEDHLTGARELASFDDEEKARRRCTELEHSLRSKVNPFVLRQGLVGLTSLGSGVFCDWLLDAGIDPPPEADGRRDWAGWYERCQGSWDEASRARFWEALDLLRFFRVAERPARKGYVVLEVGWLWHDEPPYDTEPECRRAVEVFADRAAAERRRRDLESRRRAEWPETLELAWAGGSGGPADAPLYEVVEVDWEGAP